MALAQTSRREMAVLLAGGLLSGCATAAQPRAAGWTPALPARGVRLRLAPVHVSEDRVIRVVTGLRPYRPKGFVVRSEALGSKRLVHNYGHGGGGVTLSWGTADLAVEQGFAGEGDYAVLGCGAVGLATARLLQRHGGKVTIYAAALPPDTTSNIAGAQWWPFSVYDRHVAEPAFVAQLNEAARRAYRHFQTLTGETYGVRWTRNYSVSDHPNSPYGPGSAEDDPLRAIAPEARDLSPAEHPFRAPYVRQFDTMMVEPPVYLTAMLRDFREAGGTIRVRVFKTPAEVAALPEPVVFNCTGLGAGALFGDTDIEPAKGQLVVLLPQPEVDYNVLGGGGYMFPRRDGILLGGTFERGNWSLEPDPGETARILRQHRALFAAMRT